MQRVEREPVVPGERIAHGVERAGADVPEDDADRSDSQCSERAVVMTVAAVGVPIARAIDHGMRRGRAAFRRLWSYSFAHLG
jgi:hypothetical protein